MSLSETLPRLLEERKMKPADLSRETGISTGRISGYISGDSQPTLSKAIAIADALHISLDELAGREKPNATREQREIVALMSRMNDMGQTVALDLVKGFSANPAYIKSRQLGMVEKKEESA